MDSLAATVLVSVPPIAFSTMWRILVPSRPQVSRTYMLAGTANASTSEPADVKVMMFENLLSPPEARHWRARYLLRLTWNANSARNPIGFPSCPSAKYVFLVGDSSDCILLLITSIAMTGSASALFKSFAVAIVAFSAGLLGVVIVKTNTAWS